MSVFLVPIHLDALVLSKEESVVEEMTDYTKLPYFNKRHSPQNIRNSYLGDTVLSPPFENPNLTLDAGVHLHWALPEGLTRGVSKEDGIEFPLVPNRWLIIRSGGNQKDKQWVVESDYLYPEGKEWAYGTVNILHEPDKGIDEYQPDKGIDEYQPFRFLGRKLELSEWNPKDSNAKYLEELTAVGPKAKVKMLDNEKVTFAAFYPNCRSVFGFHDADYAGQTPPKGLTYEVIGWYSDSGNDCLTRLKKRLEKEEQNKEVNESQTWLEAIKEQFGWTVTQETLNSKAEETLNSKAEEMLNFNDLQRVLCYARLQFDNSGSKLNELNDPKEKPLNLTIAVGNTGSEALAAYLAHKIKGDSKDTEKDKKNKKLIEEQLEALQLSDRLEQETLDIVPKFKEALHEQGFFASSSGVLWRVVPEGNNSAPADAAEKEGQLLVSLPKNIAEELGTLNHRQQDYDKALAEIGAMREQVYADWYKYMIEVPRSGEFDERIKFFMQEKVIPLLTKKLSDTGDLRVYKDDSGEIVRAETANSNNQSTASKLAESINELIAKLREFNMLSRFQVDSSSSQETKLNLERGDCSLVTDPKAGKCLSFDNNENCLLLSGFSNVKAISIWVNRLNSSSGLLELFNEMKRLYCTKMFINYEENGEKKQKQLGFNYDWQKIPKEQWTLVYLELQEEVSSDDYLVIKFTSTGSGKVSERIASVRLHQQALTEEQIQQEYQEKTYFLKPTYTLKATSGPRYWQPNDPVILMVGDAVTPTSRQGQDGSLREEDDLLKCSLLVNNVNWQNLPESRKIIKTQLDAIAPKSQGEKIGFYRWTEQPWNPFLLEWGVRLYPCSHNTTPTNPDYKADHIKKNYTLPVNEIDLVARSKVEDDFFEGISSYQGASLLSPPASSQLKEKLATYLMKNNEKEAGDIYKALQAAYNELQSLKCLAQSLGGFNDFLLTYQRTLQLEIKDPFAAPPKNKDQHDEQAGRWQFTEEVREAVANSAIADQLSLLRSPHTDNDFNPIRNGAMNISGLRIVDTFGRFKVVVDPRRPEATQVVTIESLAPPANSKYQIYLPPRIVQPARLNFRWLSAPPLKKSRFTDNQEPDSPLSINAGTSIHHNGDKGIGAIIEMNDLEEMNDHPATSPICGWLVPNKLNSSLMVYDSQGSPLGIIDRNAKWQQVPNIDELKNIDTDIHNPYLQTLVKFLCADERKPGFLGKFLETLNSALETIDPEAFAQHQGLALLMGRPIALVRAKVNLELQGARGCQSER